MLLASISKEKVKSLTVAVFITKQKSLGWSKTSKRKRAFKFVESIGRKDQLNIHRLSSSSW